MVPENRLVVFRHIGHKGPGLVWLWPVLDRAVAGDLREQVLEVPHQTTITKDNAPISIDFLVYSRIVNPVEIVVQVADFARASQSLATTTLRAVIGDIQLDDVVAMVASLLRAEIFSLLYNARASERDANRRDGHQPADVALRPGTDPRRSSSNRTGRSRRIRCAPL